MNSENTLLSIRQGKEGSFVNWLEDLGLKDFIGHYSLPKLIEWGWLVPRNRVIFPVEFFLAWQHYPAIGGENLQGFEVESALWDSVWRIRDKREICWFLHPFFRPDDACCERLQNTKYENNLPSIPEAFIHPRNRSIIPYADYFFHWQAYALVDVIRLSDHIRPLLNTPDVVERAEGIVRIAERIKDANWKDILTLNNRWGGLAEPMTWISHYKALRNTLNWNENGRNLRSEGAKQLADHLGMTSTLLECAIKDKLLVLAQEWRGANERYCVWTLRAWPYLQTDIAIAVEWLCYINEKSLDDYLDLWIYSSMGQQTWAELHKVLPFEFFEDRQTFFEFAPIYYTKHYEDRLPNNEKIKQLVNELQKTNYPFRSFLSAFRLLHEQLSFNPKQKGSLDFRELRMLDYYLLFAIRAESCLRYYLEANQLLQTTKSHSLIGYIIKISEHKSYSQSFINYLKSKEAKNYTHLGNTPKNPINNIIEINLENFNKKDTQLLQAFLCCLLARNYFAHHIYMDSELLNSKESGFMLAGILVTVLTLLDDTETQTCSSD